MKTHFYFIAVALILSIFSCQPDQKKELKVDQLFSGFIVLQQKQKGSNTIAIRAIDTGGPGAFIVPMTLSNGSGDVVSIESSWKYKTIAEIYMNKFYIYNLQTDISERPDVLKFHSNLPAVLFNGMINPLVPYIIKEAIWYQGEANVGRAEEYKHLFPAMIEDCRDQWGYDFPFYFVQIAPFIYNPNPGEQVIAFYTQQYNFLTHLLFYLVNEMAFLNNFLNRLIHITHIVFSILSQFVHSNHILSLIYY